MGNRWVLSLIVLLTAAPAIAALPPVPVPTENPLTEEKRVLGKILFWDEQLSSNNTIACGSCHMAGDGGSDGRVGVNPGPDALAATADDILGSPGVALMDSSGQAVVSPTFGLDAQVTGRASMTTVGSAYAREAFWDGRAGTVFLNPTDDSIAVAAGGALENQALGPILSEVEMANAGRSWDDVTAKLTASFPLARSSNLPADARDAIELHPTYPELFEQAFGDSQITAERIAFAIATYERTLTANETPWDRFTEGDNTAMTAAQIQGWTFFRASPCSSCHAPPTFTDQDFRNIGLRPSTEDSGRQGVTGRAQDAGRFKVPTLRNTGLKITHMHNGQLTTIRDSVLWYRPNNPLRFTDNLDPRLPVGVPGNLLNAVVDFISNGLTDPRVASETFPFDRPTLHSGELEELTFDNDKLTLTWPTLEDVQSFNIYRGFLSDLTDANADRVPDGGYGDCVSGLDDDPSDAMFRDDTARLNPGEGFFYLKTAVDLQGFETTLGSSSAGLARSAGGICP